MPCDRSRIRARIPADPESVARPHSEEVCMTSRLMRRLIFVCTTVTILAVPVVGHAQEATFGGTVTDTTGAVLPGVTITAVNEASGNNFEAVTDAHGTYRLA